MKSLTLNMAKIAVALVFVMVTFTSLTGADPQPGEALDTLMEQGKEIGRALVKEALLEQLEEEENENVSETPIGSSNMKSRFFRSLVGLGSSSSEERYNNYGGMGQWKRPTNYGGMGQWKRPTNYGGMGQWKRPNGGSWAIGPKGPKVGPKWPKKKPKGQRQKGPRPGQDGGSGGGSGSGSGDGMA